MLPAFLEEKIIYATNEYGGMCKKLIRYINLTYKRTTLYSGIMYILQVLVTSK